MAKDDYRIQQIVFPHNFRHLGVDIMHGLLIGVADRASILLPGCEAALLRMEYCTGSTKLDDLLYRSKSITLYLVVTSDMRIYFINSANEFVQLSIDQFEALGNGPNAVLNGRPRLDEEDPIIECGIPIAHALMCENKFERACDLLGLFGNSINAFLTEYVGDDVSTIFKFDEPVLMLPVNFKFNGYSFHHVMMVMDFNGSIPTITFSRNNGSVTRTSKELQHIDLNAMMLGTYESDIRWFGDQELVKLCYTSIEDMINDPKLEFVRVSNPIHHGSVQLRVVNAIIDVYSGRRSQYGPKAKRDEVIIEA